jgi:hypothetical protein
MQSINHFENFQQFLTFLARMCIAVAILLLFIKLLPSFFLTIAFASFCCADKASRKRLNLIFLWSPLFEFQGSVTNS